MTIPLLAKAAILGGAAYIASRVVRSRQLASAAPTATATPVAPLPSNDPDVHIRSAAPTASIGPAG